MLRWRHEHEDAPTRLARRAAATRLGVEAKQQGWKQQDIAAALGVTPGAVSQWLKHGREQGVDGLQRRPAPGPTPTLSAAQLAQLPTLLERGAEAYGFRGQVWTCKRAAEVIRRTFGVSYHPAHVSRLLHPLRQSVQRPHARAAPRSAPRRLSKRGGASAGPPWKKSRRGRANRRLGRPVWLLSPAHGGADVGATGADAALDRAAHPRPPRGQQRDHAREALVHADARAGYHAHADDVVRLLRLLRLLLRKVRGKLLVIWDGAPIHRGQPVKDFLRRGAARRLHLEQLPAYAPELNPDEGIWNYLKRVELGNQCGQPVLPRPGGVDNGAASGQRASAAQARGYPGVFLTGGLPCLAVHATISKWVMRQGLSGLASARSRARCGRSGRSAAISAHRAACFTSSSLRVMTPGYQSLQPAPEQLRRELHWTRDSARSLRAVAFNSIECYRPLGSRRAIRASCYMGKIAVLLVRDSSPQCIIE